MKQEEWQHRCFQLLGQFRSVRCWNKNLPKKQVQLCQIRSWTFRLPCPSPKKCRCRKIGCPSHIYILEIGIKLSEQMKRILVDSTNCCWHFSRVTQTDREYGLMSSSKIGLVKITCHESLHSSHDVEFLHSYQQSYTSTWDKLLSPQCIIQDFLNSYIHRSVRQILKPKEC